MRNSIEPLKGHPKQHRDDYGCPGSADSRVTEAASSGLPLGARRGADSRVTEAASSGLPLGARRGAFPPRAGGSILLRKRTSSGRNSPIFRGNTDSNADVCT
jgi:hypothetical protein